MMMTAQQPYTESARKGARSKRKSRKRRRQPPLLVSLARLQYQAPFEPSEPNHPDYPEWEHFSHLLGGLLLTSGLAVISGFDAKTHCLRHETYVLLEFTDDDAVNDKNYEQAAETAAMQHYTCSAIFRNIVVPSGVGTAVASCLGLGLVLWQQRAERSKRALQLNSSNLLSVDTDFRKVFEKLAILLALLLCIVAWQTYNVAAIMLTPRTMDEKEENPFQSLAAVDRYGHVGDNANLYYLTWMSEALAVALFYQVATACVRAARRARRQQQQQLRPSTTGTSNDVTTLLRTTSWTWWQEHRRRQKSAWYSSLYKLRFRSGIWVGALATCCVIVASSQYVGSQILWPLVAEEYSRKDWSALSTYLSVCQAIADAEAAERQQSDGDYYGEGHLPPQFCSRTVAAWFSGLIAAFLCATAIGMHLAARYCHSHSPSRNSFLEASSDHFEDDDHPATFPWSAASHHHKLTAWERVRLNRRLPLRTELFLSFLLSILTGFNAVFATGVQGPASTVGNLYYASWIAYLLCVRIALGCLEEFYNLEDDEQDSESDSNPASTNNAAREKQTTAELSTIDASTDPEPLPYQAPSLDEVSSQTSITPSRPKKAKPSPRRLSSMPTVESSPSRITVKSMSSNNSTTLASDSVEKARLGHVRSYFFLSIFSVACAASAYDAASNQATDVRLTKIQLYMIFAPCAVSVQSIILTSLCLSKRCYEWVSYFFVGGVLSMVAFGLWLGNLILTMHSEDSWAVNGIGEIEMANLYYFSWASILTAGIQMSTYVKGFLGIKMDHYMSVVWVAIVKVCFVILGAALHIWHTISDNCGIEEITSGAVTFCSRTVLAIVVSLTGMLVGGLVLLVRMFVLAFPFCHSRRLQAHVEMIMSLFLVLVFGAAVALITGIGGPGQSVGDLYYSTWLAFWVSLGVFVSCYSELNAEEQEWNPPTTTSSSARNYADNEPNAPFKNAVLV